MDSLMNEQVRAAGEGLSTLITHVRKIATVNPLVHNKAGELTEGFSTLAAVIRFLCSVDSLVHDQV